MQFWYSVTLKYCSFQCPCTRGRFATLPKAGVLLKLPPSVIGCLKKDASPCVQNQMSPWCSWRVHSPSASSSQNGPRTFSFFKIVFISSYPLISLFKTRCNSPPNIDTLTWMTLHALKSRDEQHWWKLSWRMVLTMVCRCDCLFCPLPLAVDP